MEYMAQWGPKGFLISSHKIVILEDFSTSTSLKSNSENDTSGTAPTNTRGLELRPISFSVEYLRAAGVDPRAQLEEWENLVGKKYPLIIGGKRFGPNYMILKKVDASDISLSAKGDFLSVTVKITLEEYSNGQKSKLSKTTKKTAKKTSTSGSSSAASKAASTYAKTVEKKKAMKTTATATDKATKQVKRKGLAALNEPERRLSS